MTAYVPVERLQGLVDRWRNPKWEATNDDEQGFLECLGYCADELQAVLSQAVEVDEATQATYCHDQDTHRLMCEDVWAFHKMMDEAGIRRTGEKDQTLSMYGRSVVFARMLADKEVGELRAALLAAMGGEK